MSNPLETTTATLANATALAENIYQEMIGRDISKANIDITEYFLSTLISEINKNQEKEQRNA